jgi:integrase
MGTYNMAFTALPRRKELIMKGRVQEKNGYWYVVINVEKSVTPVWRKTGIQAGKKGTRVYNQTKKLAEDKIDVVIGQYRQEISDAPATDHNPTAAYYSAALTVEPALVTNSAPVPSCITETARAYRQNRPKVGQDILFEHAVDLYLKSATHLKGNSLEKYKYAAEHIKAWFGARQLFVSEINALDVTEYFRHKSLGLNNDGSEPTDEKIKKMQSLGKSTLKDHKIVLNQTWQFCTDSLKIVDVSNNPMLAVKIGKIPLHSNYLTAEQANRLLQALASDGERLEIIAAVVFALYYGFRRQEVLGMRWAAVDMKADTVLVCRTATRIGNDIVYEDTTKTQASYRTMPLFPLVKKVLLKLQDHQQEMRQALGRAYPKGDYIIKWDDGRLLRPDYLTSHFSDLMLEYSEKLGIEKVTFHQLRHSAASLLATNSHTPQEIAIWLGQASTRSAERYTHLQVQETKNRLFSTIDGALAMPEIAV